MGCWNGTCGLSQLAIHHGDPVVGFFLESKALAAGFDGIGSGGICYSTGLSAPFFIPIHGEYNDYGSIENIKKGSDVLRKFIMGDKTFTLVPDSCDDKKETPKPKNLEELVDIVERGRCMFNWHPEFGKGSLGLVMFHDHIYREMVRSLGERVPYQQKKTYKELLVDRMKKTVDHALKAKKDVEEAGRDVKKLSKAFLLTTSTLEKLFVFGNEGAFYNKRIFDFSLDKVQPDNLVDALVSYTLMIGAMEFLRKHWVPQAGAGSQSTEHGLHKVLFNAAEGVMKSYREKYLEENEEDVPAYVEETIYWRDR